MAEWLGHLMSSWPTLLIGVAVIVIGIVWIFYTLAVYGGADTLWERHHSLKKRERELKNVKD